MAQPEAGARFESEGEWVEVYARSALPSEYGDFSLFVVRSSFDSTEHVVLSRPHSPAGDDVPVRLHSECLTGEVLGSLRCDCRPQLARALKDLGRRSRGLLIYLRQEGRGIGLGNKVRAYRLQEQGLNTYQANHQLGFDSDLRNYRVAAMILHLFGVHSVQLLTNNPQKVEGLKQHGIAVSRRVSLQVDPNPHNREYLGAKAKAGHFLSED